MPHDLPILKDLIILLLVSVPIAFIGSRLRLPVIVGFMIAGVLIGPSGFGLIEDARAIEVLAEIGVVLLLFAIGLEFSLRRMMEMQRLVLMGGGLQVIFTSMLICGLVYLLGRSFNQALLLGFLCALSSTAIVLKCYSDRAEIDTPHGRAGVGMLLLQDLSVVPMMLMVPLLAGKEGVSAARIAQTLGAALAVIAVIILAARIVMPYLLSHIVRLRSHEVFVIFIVLASLGTSWLTAQFGLSLALGAFVAGLVLSESEYSHQIVADILPFRDVFNSVFFISIGMLLSVGFVAANMLTVMGWVGALVLVKAGVVLAVMRLLKFSLRISTMTAMGLAQVGEFSFIVAKVGLGQGLLAEDDYQKFLAAAILSMIATPFLIRAAPRIGYRVQMALAPGSRLEPQMADFAPEGEPLRGHTIVVGYGLNGRNLSTVLRRAGIPYLIVELNADAVREATARGEPVQYGDATRREVLERAGVEAARLLVLAISDPIATRRAVQFARDLNPQLRIIVRTRYVAEVLELYQLGADQVIPEEFETSVEIFSRVLREYGIARQDIQRETEKIRRAGYEMLRHPSLPEANEIAHVLNSASTETLLVDPGSSAIGLSVGELDLRRRTGAALIAVIREGQTTLVPGPDFRLAAGDIGVLFGGPNEIERAVSLISTGEE
jgi:CPA2 family monovalent cation:H+ antiporter-2